MSTNESLRFHQLFAEAVQHHHAGRLRDAEIRYRQILAADPGHAEALHGLGVLARQTGRNDLAVQIIATVVRLRPNFPEAHSNLGACLNDLGRFEEAATALEIAVRLKPDYVDAQYNLGTALTNLERFDEAVAAHRCAIRLKPDHADAYYNLGTSLAGLGRQEEAIAAYDSAIRLKSNHAATYYNLGISLTELGRLDDALAALETAIRLKPDFAEARYQKAVVYLLRGEYAKGWPEYEWRWRDANRLLKSRRFSQPQWQGEDISGRTILLHAEQGLGDAIQFVRYAPLVAARGARVLLATYPSLLRLLSGLTGVERLIAIGEPPPVFDFHCPLMSLPGLFGTTVETVPANIPYLSAEPALVNKWQAQIGAAGFKIGIAWQGTPNIAIDRGRSIPLACFAPVAGIPSVRLISLQKRHGLEQMNRLPAGMRVETLGDNLDGGPDAFIDRAAAMMSLDLVITSDTSIAHLAGALGRPVWLALKKIPYWVFMTDRPDSPWYPSMRLFRQTEQGDWNGVFQRMVAELLRKTREVR